MKKKNKPATTNEVVIGCAQLVPEPPMMKFVHGDEGAVTVVLWCSPKIAVHNVNPLFRAQAAALREMADMIDANIQPTPPSILQ